MFQPTYFDPRPTDDVDETPLGRLIHDLLLSRLEYRLRGGEIDKARKRKAEAIAKILSENGIKRVDDVLPLASDIPPDPDLAHHLDPTIRMRSIWLVLPPGIALIGTLSSLSLSLTNGGAAWFATLAFAALLISTTRTTMSAIGLRDVARRIAEAREIARPILVVAEGCLIDSNELVLHRVGDMLSLKMRHVWGLLERHDPKIMRSSRSSHGVLTVNLKQGGVLEWPLYTPASLSESIWNLLNATTR